MSEAIARLQQLRRAGGCFFLEPRTRLKVQGADRLRYLNGQVSNDLRRLSPGTALPALVLTAKGKLCADVFVWSEGETLMIDADAAVREALSERLERYIVADDVELLPTEEKTWHVFGEAATGRDGVKLSRLGVPGVDLSECPEGLTEATVEEVELLRIERGVPRWGAELTENTLPQEARLEQTAVDFAKGCYVGQEIVSRLKSVGHVNHKLTGFIGDFDVAIGKKSVLRTLSGEAAGRLTSTAHHFELAKTAALGYLHTRFADARFSVFDETGACLGEAERREFPLLS